MCVWLLASILEVLLSSSNPWLCAAHRRWELSRWEDLKELEGFLETLLTLLRPWVESSSLHTPAPKKTASQSPEGGASRISPGYSTPSVWFTLSRETPEVFGGEGGSHLASYRRGSPVDYLLLPPSSSPSSSPSPPPSPPVPQVPGVARPWPFGDSLL